MALKVLESGCLRFYTDYVIFKMCQEILEGKFILYTSLKESALKGFRGVVKTWKLGFEVSGKFLTSESSSNCSAMCYRSWYMDVLNSNSDGVSDLVSSQPPVVLRQTIAISPNPSRQHNQLLIVALCSMNTSLTRLLKVFNPSFLPASLWLKSSFLA